MPKTRTGESTMKRMIPLFYLLLGAGSLSAQTYDYFSPSVLTLSGTNQVVFDKQTNKLLSEKANNYFSPYALLKSNAQQNNIGTHRTNFFSLFRTKDFSSSSENNSHTSIWTEMGYVLAMESFFTGMSYLASRKNNYGPTITGSFDLFMGFAGIHGVSNAKSITKKSGLLLISAGFIAKSLYNFRLGKNHETKTRFLTNFIGFNILVFTGYYLDALN